MMKSLFNFPYYQNKIPSHLYNKNELIDSIMFNYKKDQSRNNWNTNCDMHHEFNDDSENFIKINYKELIPVYTKVIGDFIDQISYNQRIKWNYEIINYTVTRNSQNMWPHHHIPSTFSAVHYIKFNPNQHQSSIFFNPSNYRTIFDFHYGDFIQSLCSEDENNMWAFSSRTINVEEDDIIITPSIVEHAIGKSNSDEERISIILNINISKDNSE